MLKYVHAGSLTNRLREFFTRNRDEYLTMADIALKLECTREQAQRAVETLREQGLVETMHIVRGIGCGDRAP